MVQFLRIDPGKYNTALFWDEVELIAICKSDLKVRIRNLKRQNADVIEEEKGLKALEEAMAK